MTDKTKEEYKEKVKLLTDGELKNMRDACNEALNEISKIYEIIQLQKMGGDQYWDEEKIQKIEQGENPPN